jgi:hypothetical protein
MRVKVKIHGHQTYMETAGEVMAWVQTVEKFGDQPMQVPAVIVLTDEGDVKVVSLTTQHHWTEIEEQYRLTQS